MTSPSDSYSLYTSTVLPDPPLLMQHSRPILTFKSLISFLSILSLLCLFFAPLPPPLVSGCPSTPPASSPPPDSLRVLQWNAGGLRARSTELLHFLSSHLVDLICDQEFNLNSSSSFGFLDSLLCVLITPTPGPAFSLVRPHTLAAASSFSSGRSYLSLNFLPPLFLCLTPTLIM